MPALTARGAVRFDRVSKRFNVKGMGPVIAAHDVSFEVLPGESVAILGPNGAGKSTLLKMASGVSAPSAGAIERVGRVAAVIELGAGMHPDLSGRENLVIAAAFVGLTEAQTRERSEKIVAFAGLEAKIDDPVRTYSTGMVARLAFSVAAHSDPDILMLDEVASVGDLEFQRRSEERILAMISGGTTVLLVTHDLGLASSVCRRAVLLEHGAVVADGPTDAIVRRYTGQPEPLHERPDEAIRVDVHPAVVTAPEPLTVTLHVDDPNIVADARIDLVLHDHPAFAELGVDISMVVGTGALPHCRTGTTAWTVDTEHIPPGRFDVCVVLEAPDGGVIAQRRREVRVIGSPGPPAVRLEASWELVRDLDGDIRGAGKARVT